MKEDRRIQKTKIAITNALLELLEVQDFNEITINAIADKANVNRGTIYFHYEDKYDLLNKCVEEKLSLLQNICAPIRIDSSLKELHIYFESVYQFFDDNYNFFFLMLKNGGTIHFQERFKDQILKEMRRMIIAGDDTNINEFFIQFKVHALVGVVEWWISEDHGLSVKDMADNTVSLFLKNKF